MYILFIVRMKNQLPTQEYLLQILEYRDGQLFWKRSKGNYKIGDIAGCLSDRYYILNIDKIKYYQHNVIWKMLTGKDPEYQIDHINHTKTDNRIENLRDVNQLENSKNRSKNKNNTSGHANIRIANDNRLKKFMVIFKNEKYSKGFLTLEEAIQHRNEKYIEFNFHQNHGLT